MAKLTADEEKALAELEAKRDAPDDSKSRGDLSVFIDLSDDKAVQRGLKLGYLEPSDLDDDGDDDGDDDDSDDGDSDDGDSKKKQKKDPAPRRRLTMADRMLGGDGDE